MLISEAFNLYREREVMAAGLSTNTDETYAYAGQHAINFLGDIEVSDIQISDITKFYEHLMGWQKPDTARGYMVCFRAVIKYLRRKRYVQLELRTDKNPALFITNQTGKRLTPGNAQRIFRNLRQRCELGEIHPHTLRHSFATCMLAHGVDLCYIGDMMGHQSLDTTKMYTHYENPRLKKIHKSVMG